MTRLEKLAIVGYLALLVSAMWWLHNHPAKPPVAQEARLIGLCNGKLLAAMTKDQFPSGCQWIERINYQ